MGAGQTGCARKKIRLDRKYIVSCKQAEMPLSVPWDPSNQVYLSYNNVSSLKMLVAKDNWVLSSESNQVRLYTLEEDKFLSFHMEMLVHVDTAQAFLLLSDLRRRPVWDKHCRWVSYYNQATPGVLKYVTTNVTGLSSEFYTTFKACEHFLLDNWNDLAPSLQTL
ncbi:acyl-coenzyme A thioesterase 11-like [Bos mutus]|uniref:acyl-coenzyme A thioesterase 11-like n=1 Tax=Bos mutus TaxID=72004 RepID=UPI0038B43C9C